MLASFFYLMISFFFFFFQAEDGIRDATVTGVQTCALPISNNDPDEFITVLRTYFSTVRSLFGKEWRDPDNCIVSTNRGVSAFLKLLRSMFRTEKRQLAHQDFKKYLSALKREWKSWKFADLKKTYVGSQGWADFHKDLVAAIRKHYPYLKK